MVPSRWFDFLALSRTKSMTVIRPHLARVVALTSLSVAGLSGCADVTVPQDSFPRVAVSGTVSLNGAPLPTGMIQFNPASEIKGPQASGEIVAGKFTISQAQGPVPGKHKVSISGKPAVNVKPNEEPGGTPKAAPEPVPAKYNKQSTLETEIPTGGSSTLEFELKK